VTAEHLSAQQIIRAALKPYTDCSEIGAHELLENLRKGGYVIATFGIMDTIDIAQRRAAAADERVRALEHQSAARLRLLEQAADDGEAALRQLDEARAEIDRLTREIADLRPYADAGRHAAEETAKREYYTGTCDDCSCCTNAQCRERRCPENSIGESTCPCTCE
jgi:hypothetical protein